LGHLPDSIRSTLERYLGEPLIEVRSVRGGSISHAAQVSTPGGAYFVKWNTQGAPDQFLREFEGLEALRRAQLNTSHPLQVPRPLYCAPSSDVLEDHHTHHTTIPTPFLLMEWIETDRVGARFDERLGQGLASLYRASAPQFGFIRHNYCGTTRQDNTWRDDWATFYTEQRIAPLIRIARDQRELSGDQLRMFTILLNRLPEWISTDESPALIHGDLWYGNVLETSHDPPALIDPAVSYAHREAELGMMELFGGFSPRVWASYQAHYPLSAGWRERLPLYTLYHLLNHFVLFGGSYGRQACDIARRFVGRS
jgi:fructosamine-3-kinase